MGEKKRGVRASEVFALGWIAGTLFGVLMMWIGGN